MSSVPLLKQNGDKKSMAVASKATSHAQTRSTAREGCLFRLLRLARFTRRALSGGQFM